MNNRYIISIFLAGLLAALVLGAGYLSVKEDSNMVLAGERTAKMEKIPPMDKKAPARTQTATFALG